MGTNPKKVKLVIDAWPQLIDAIDRHKMLGINTADIAKFLLVEALESRERERHASTRARNGAIASGWRGAV